MIRLVGKFQRVVLGMMGLVLILSGALPVSKVWAQDPEAGFFVGMVRGIDINPDSDQIALGYADKIEIRTLETGALLRELATPVRAQAWGNGLIDWHPSLALLAVGDRQSVALWNPETGEHLRTVELDDQLSNMAWYPEGEILIVGLWDGTLWIVDLAETAPQLLLKAENPISALAVSSQGQIAFGQKDSSGLISIMTLEGQIVQTLSAAPNLPYPVVLLAWSGDDAYLSANLDQGDVRGYSLIWEVATGQITTQMHLPTASMFTWYEDEDEPLLTAITHLVDMETDQTTIDTFTITGEELHDLTLPKVRPFFIVWAKSTLVIVDTEGYLHRVVRVHS